MNGCVFCVATNPNSDEITHNKLFRARWDLNPVAPGHALIVPLRHVQYFKDLTDDEVAGMMSFTREVIDIIDKQNLSELYAGMKQHPLGGSELFLDKVARQLEATNGVPPQGYNFGLNDGPVAGQSVPHLHLHIMPRWEGDIENPRGGVRNMFQGDTYGSMS